MKVPPLLTLGLCLSMTFPVLAQQRGRQHQPQQRQQQPQTRQRPQARQRTQIPNPPPREMNRNTPPRVDRHPHGYIDRTPHYRDGRWYGRPSPNDPRFHLQRPFAHGHFRDFGPRYIHRIVRFDRSNYWFWLASGYYFQIASWDWPYCANWCWTCGDEFVIYLDPDHTGWYLIYNVHTGVFVHAIFMGR